MLRSVAETAEGLGEDGDAWRRLFGSSSTHFDALLDDVFAPIIHLPSHPIRSARFGIPAATPATLLASASGPGAPARCSAGSRHMRSAVSTAR